jgi:hypothetical protein
LTVCRALLLSLMLVSGSSADHLTVQIRVRGRRVRVWRIKAAPFNGDDGDT